MKEKIVAKYYRENEAMAGACARKWHLSRIIILLGGGGRRAAAGDIGFHNRYKTAALCHHGVCNVVAYAMSCHLSVIFSAYRMR